MKITLEKVVNHEGKTHFSIFKGVSCLAAFDTLEEAEARFEKTVQAHRENAELGTCKIIKEVEI